MCGFIWFVNQVMCVGKFKKSVIVTLYRKLLLHASIDNSCVWQYYIYVNLDFNIHGLPSHHTSLIHTICTLANTNCPDKGTLKNWFTQTHTQNNTIHDPKEHKRDHSCLLLLTCIICSLWGSSPCFRWLAPAHLGRMAPHNPTPSTPTDTNTTPILTPPPQPPSVPTITNP